MKKSKLNLIIRIFGIILILVGITLAVIPLFNFDVLTFKLMPELIFALGFPFVGFVLIALSYMINTVDDDNIESTKKKK